MATAKDTSFSSQEKTTTNILHFHCKDKTCKGKRQFYPCGFKPGQSHILFYSVIVLIYITTCTYAVKFRSSCQWNTAVKWLRHLVMEEAVPWAGKFLLPVPASPPLCSFRPPTGYGESDEGQSWAHTSQFNPAKPENSPWDGRGDPELLQCSRESWSWHKGEPNSPELQREKKERAKQTSHF